ncbi:MAG: hypothetical protein JNL08_17700 [Planctomycetes bacterium]|nr:hypothetical protein [Planctomycetota bacterium]
MRSSALILLLLLALALGLGLRTWLRPPAAVPPLPAQTERAAPTAPLVAPTTPATVPQGHVYTGVSEQPEDVNPLTQHSLIATRLLSYTHDGLLDGDPQTGALRGALAEAWSPSADGGSCTFTLRRGVRFADGSPLTLADVLFAWRLAAGGSFVFGNAGLAFDRVAAVDELDEWRFCVHFRDRHYAAVQVVGENWPVVCRRWWLARVAELAAQSGGDVPAEDSPAFAVLLAQVRDECGPGTGPYELQNRPGGGNWQRGQELTLVRNEHCWRREVQPGTWNFAALRFRFLDGAAALNALLRGELDWYGSAAIDDLLRSRPELATAYRQIEYDYRQLGVYTIVWNCRRPPFDDARVRRALARLFDREAILAAFGGHGVPGLAYAKPDGAEYPRDVEPYGFDVGRARAELREAGFGADLGRPLRLALLAPEGPEAMRRTLDLFASAARQAGIELDLRVREWTTFVAAKKADEWDGMFVLQGFRTSGDPYDFVHSHGPDNHGGWASAAADRLATEVRAEFDPERRTGLLRELHALVHAEQPVAFLLHPRVALLLNRQVEGAAPGPFGLSIERAFVRAEHQRR